MAAVYIPNKYKSIVEQCSARIDGEAGPIFETNMHLMIFSALLGAELDEYDDGDWERGNEIQDRTFYANNMEGVVYLLALYKNKTVDALRSGSEYECWRIFESYAAGGFGVIESWLLDSPEVVDVADVFLNNIKNRASSILDDSESPVHVPPIKI